jgi:pterin-4a-carbinolamine dehydratase
VKTLTEIARDLARQDITVPARVPISPKSANHPLIPVDRWSKQPVGDGEVLLKTYTFRREKDVDRFVVQLLAYERRTNKHASLVIKRPDVSVTLTTEGLEQVTERDKEYAAFADVLFRDTVYNPENEED